MVGFMKSALNLFGIKKNQDGAASGVDEFLNSLPEQLGYNIEFKKSQRPDGGTHFEIAGEEADSFIGNSSEVLDALSHLAMRVQRRTEGLSNEPVTDDNKDAFRITFDAAGFRDRKAQELRDLAAEKRQKVLETGGKPSYIQALSPSDRKIIHTHLVDLGDVVSESIGKGNFKRIRIRLKDESKRTYQPSENEGNEQQRSANGGGQRGPNGGGRRGGRGGRGGGRNGGRGRGPSNGHHNHNGNGEVDGNRMPSAIHADEPMIDENIGNRLAPGEEPIFNYGNSSAGHGNNND